MWCYVYKSTKKENSYLYIGEQENFINVPEALLKVFGQPHFVMKLLLNEKRKLVAGTAEYIKNKIIEDGYFLQVLNDDDFFVKGIATN